MSQDDINPHAFDEHKLDHDSRQKTIDRVLAYETDTRSRVDTLVKAVFALSGGALTISIGLFLRSDAPPILESTAAALRLSWYSLFYSLVASTTLLFVMICQGYWQAAQWQKTLANNSSSYRPGALATLVRVLNWLVGFTGFVALLTGLGLLAHASVESIRVRPNPSVEARPNGGRPPSAPPHLTAGHIGANQHGAASGIHTVHHKNVLGEIDS